MIRSISAHQEEGGLREALETETTAGFFLGQNAAGNLAGAVAKIELSQTYALTSTIDTITSGDIFHNGYREIIDEVNFANSSLACTRFG